MPPLTPLIRRLSSAQAVPSKDDLAKQKSKAESSHKGSRNYSRCTSGGRPPPPESVSLPDDLPIPDAAPQSSGSRVDLQAFTATILAALSLQLDGLSSSVDAIIWTWPRSSRVSRFSRRSGKIDAVGAFLSSPMLPADGLPEMELGILGILPDSLQSRIA